MTTIICILLIGCGIIGMFASPKFFLIVTTIFLLGVTYAPVAYRYFVTGDGSLAWEAAFCTALLMIAAWAAKQFIRIEGSGLQLFRHR